MTRRIISLTLFIACIVLILSSIILYIAPEGRVAYWGNWHSLGVTKQDWGNLHITGGVLFLLCSLWHIVLNWKPLVAYVKRKTQQSTVVPVALLVALGLNGLVYFGTLYGWQPMQQILVWKDAVKEYQAKVNGNPPYGHAELSSVTQLCAFLSWDVQKVLTTLQRSGLQGTITEKSVILDIAKTNNLSPQAVYKIMQEAIGSTPFAKLPPSPPEGTGKKSLKALCTEYDLPLSDVLGKLQTAGIEASENDTISAIAGRSGKTPPEVYQLIRQ